MSLCCWCSPLPLCCRVKRVHVIGACLVGLGALLALLPVFSQYVCPRRAWRASHAGEHSADLLLGLQTCATDRWASACLLDSAGQGTCCSVSLVLDAARSLQGLVSALVCVAFMSSSFVILFSAILSAMSAALRESTLRQKVSCVHRVHCHRPPCCSTSLQN